MNEQVVNAEFDTRFRMEYDPTAPNALTHAIIEAVAGAEDASPMDIEPISESVDLEALETFIRHAAASGRQTSVFVGLSLPNWDLLVCGDGRIQVYESGALATDYLVDVNADASAQPESA